MLIIKPKPIIKIFLNTLVATSWNAFAGDIVVKSRDAIKLHQEKYDVNSVIPHTVLASDYGLPSGSFLSTSALAY